MTLTLLRHTMVLSTSIALIAATALAEHVIDLGSHGQVYEIVEENALDAIIERASEVNWAAHMDEEKMQRKIRDYRPPTLTRSIPTATTESYHTVDMTYTLQWDIPDGKGGILYPAGYRFNPLEYLHSPLEPIVFINADDDDQVQWYAQSEYPGTYHYLLLTQGNHWDVREQFSESYVTPYYANDELLQKLVITAVPAVAHQVKHHMEIHQFPPPEITDEATELKEGTQ